MIWRRVLAYLCVLNDPPAGQMIPGQTAYYCVSCRWVCDGKNKGRCRRCASYQAISIEALVKRELLIIERRLKAQREEQKRES